MLENIKPYDKNEFYNYFESTDIYLKLTKDFDLITWSTKDSSFRISKMTPRQYRGTRIFSAVPFYYFRFLGFESKIYDIGCGWNIYKKYLPNLIGISADTLESPYYYGDEYGMFDDHYVGNNLQKFDNIIAMNSLHFIPLSDLQLRINQLLKVTKPGGKIFVMMNVCVLLNNQKAPIADPITYIRTQLEVFRNQILCFELDDDHIYENMSEGTLRIVLQAL